jgi:Tol biopolymer transport system component
VNTDGRVAVRQSANNWNPVFSPDGSKILFYTGRLGKGQDQIYTVSTGGSNSRLLIKTRSTTSSPAGQETAPASWRRRALQHCGRRAVWTLTR